MCIVKRRRRKSQYSLRHRCPTSTTLFPRSIIFSATLRPSRQYLLRQLAGRYITAGDVVLLLIRHSNGDLVSRRVVAMTGAAMSQSAAAGRGAQAAERRMRCVYIARLEYSRGQGISLQWFRKVWHSPL
jgi:hypothetical protein